MSAVTTRVFMNGNSQAVRIPQEFRIVGSRVQISRNEQGDLVIRAMPNDRGGEILQALRGFDDALAEELAAQVTRDRLDQAGPQERDVL